MMLTSRAIALLITLALGTGGAAWGLHSLVTSAADMGSDYGLDTNGDGKFDWLVIEAQVAIPDAGTWDIYADLSSAKPPPTGSCGDQRVWPPVPILADGRSSSESSGYPIAYVYERYFFATGVETVRMAFLGTEIGHASVDGPYAVHARISIGGFPYAAFRPLPDSGYQFIEWNYTTKAYLASEFDQPVRPVTFTGEHTDAAVDVDSDGLADFLELSAAVHVNVTGRYNLNGVLTKAIGPEAVLMVAYAYRDIALTPADATVLLRFRGDQIRQSSADGPWDFSLTLYGPMDIVYGNATPAYSPRSGILPPQPVYFPESLCGTTSAYRATTFDDTVELLRFTGRFEERTPDWNDDGTFDALLIRAEVDVFVSAGFDLAGILAGPSSTAEIARTYGQAWLAEGIQWTEFPFAGPDIRASGIDGPYEATLSLTPAAWGIDPSTTYTTRAYRATDFDAGYSNGRPYWIRDLMATASAGTLAISVQVVRGSDMLTVVYEDALTVTVTDGSGAIAGEFKDRVYLPGPGSVQDFAFTLDPIAAGTYTITVIIGPPDRPVDVQRIVVTV